MTVRKMTISLPEELAEAVALAALRRKEARSTTIATFLREHQEIAKCVGMIRSEPETTVFAASSKARHLPKAVK